MASNSGDAYTSALQTNKQWAQSTASSDPNLFPTLAAGQHPQILWLGCSDSRVPETTVLGLKPGDVFVHRNIANILPPGDVNSQSVIAYAVEHLHVKHIVVCGHTSCGGAAAALGNEKLGIIDTWLVPLRKIRAQNAAKWEKLDDTAKALALVEANVVQGVQTLRENADVIKAEHEAGLQVHGVVYDITCGELREVNVPEAEHEKKIRKAAFAFAPNRLI